MNATRICSTENCANLVSSRGLCKRCYGKAYRNGTLPPQKPKGVHRLSDIDIEKRTGICAACGPVRVKLSSGGGGHECTVGRNEQKRRRYNGPKRHIHQATRVKYKYGIPEEEYFNLVESSDGRCELCDKLTDLVVDHCHANQQVRGLLCHSCNVGLGWMRDNPTTLRKAAEYIEKSRSEFYVVTGRLL